MPRNGAHRLVYKLSSESKWSRLCPSFSPSDGRYFSALAFRSVPTYFTYPLVLYLSDKGLQAYACAVTPSYVQRYRHSTMLSR